MVDAIINFFKETLKNEYLIIIIISMIPLIELRGSIPVGIAMGMNVFEAFACAWAGSALVAPILLLILQPILKWMKKYKPFRALANAVESIFKGKASIVEDKANQEFDPKMIERRKMIGVFAFVAIPIPLTGVWTGSAVASFMGLGFVKSMLMVWAGNLVAAVIISLLSFFLADYIDYIIYALLAIVVIALVAYIVKLVLHIRKDKKSKNQEVVQKDEAQNNDNDIENK